jgi:AcrR family transcriptional regulator
MEPAHRGQRQGQGLRVEKRAAILAGASRVFIREGFTRASVDAIAAEAQVSTRTIYKHFTDKSTLIAAVIADSAGQIAADEIALVERHLGRVPGRTTAESRLIAFANAWLSITVRPAAPASLIQRVSAEAEHLGDDLIGKWWQEGPVRVRSALADHLRRWSDHGLLDIPNPTRAAVHFAQLISANPGPPGTPLTGDERRSWIAAGVRTFLRGHRPQ